MWISLIQNEYDLFYPVSYRKDTALHTDKNATN